MSDSSFVKAVIRNIDHPEKPAIQCMFNPKEYSIAKKAQWTQPTGVGKNMGDYQFGGGQPSTLSLQLMFDTFEFGTDVRAHSDEVWGLILIDKTLKDRKSGKGRPPIVCFQWGETFSFKAVITSITQKFTLFSQNGAPVRATLDVGFQEVIDETEKPKQNPTSGGLGGGRQWTVKEGDTLTAIAYEEFGDSNKWRAIADANRLTQVRRLKPGTMLEIPNLA
jgi:hypothetical protein